MIRACVHTFFLAEPPPCVLKIKKVLSVLLWQRYLDNVARLASPICILLSVSAYKYVFYIVFSMKWCSEDVFLLAPGS